MSRYEECMQKGTATLEDVFNQRGNDISLPDRIVISTSMDETNKSMEIDGTIDEPNLKKRARVTGSGDSLALVVANSNNNRREHCSYASVVQNKHHSSEETKKNTTAVEEEENTFITESVKADLFVAAEPRYEDGKVFITPSLEEARLGYQRWQSSLVGYFVDSTISFNTMSYYANSRWGRRGLKKCWKNENGYFIFKFANNNAAAKVLEDGPWMIDGKPIMLQEWNPELPLHRENTKAMPLWVRISNIPLMFWHFKGLGRIAQGIGNVIKLDSMTEVMCTKDADRCNYARILIEVESDRELPMALHMEIPNEKDEKKRIVILPVEYKWKPSWCSACTVFGHTHTSCQILKNKEQSQHVEDPKVNTMQNEKAHAEAQDDGFQVVRNKKKGKAKMGEYLPGNDRRAETYQAHPRVPQRQVGRHQVDQRRGSTQAVRNGTGPGPHHGRHEQRPQRNNYNRGQQGHVERQVQGNTAPRQGGMQNLAPHGRSVTHAPTVVLQRNDANQSLQKLKQNLGFFVRSTPSRYTEKLLSILSHDPEPSELESLNDKEWEIFQEDMEKLQGPNPEQSMKYQIMGLRKRTPGVSTSESGEHQAAQGVVHGAAHGKKHGADQGMANDMAHGMGHDMAHDMSSTSALMVLDVTPTVSHV